MGHGELLRELVKSLGWSYGVLWSIPSNMTELVWTDGWCEGSSSSKVNVERMFNSSYKTFSFTPGVGYVGKVFSHGRPMWVNGDNVHRNSITPAQATFFTSARIQTLLCFPWVGGVVELGSEISVPPNKDLLQRIRRFLSNSSVSKQQLLPRIRTISGSDDSSRFCNSLASRSQGTSSDEASGGGGDASLNPPVDSCSSFHELFSASMPLPFAENSNGCQSQNPATSAAAVTYGSTCNINSNNADGRASIANQQHATTNRASNQNQQIGPSDWRTDFDSSNHHLTLSPASTHQQAFNPLPGYEEFETSSFLVSPSSDAHDQATTGTTSVHLRQQQQAAAKTSTSSEVMSRPHRQISESLVTRNSGPGFKPWKGQKQVKRSKNVGNQVMLQRAIRMVRHMSVLNNTNMKLERKGSNSSEAQASLRQREKNYTEPRDINLSHDEAAVNHMLAERKRRERQKENFSALRALIPFVSKMDRASILSDAIQYVKQLKTRVEELERVNQDLKAQIPKPEGKPNSSV